MTNMSYCRFRNTLADLRDCFDALNEEGVENLPAEEGRAAVELIVLCGEIGDEYRDSSDD